MQLLTMTGYTDATRRGFFDRSDIDGRFLFVDPAHFAPNETVEALQARFRRGVLEIGEVAARRALERARWSPAELDYLVTTTCTGRINTSHVLSSTDQTFNG